MDRLTRMFLIGLTVPFVAFAVVALAVRPDTLLQWVAVAATIPVVSAAVAMAYAYRARTPPSVPARSRR
jgi:hypothetical protein